MALPRWRYLEWIVLAAILLAALVVRTSRLGELEPNVSPVEVANLSTMESLASGHGPRLLELTPTGASGLALALPLLLVPLVGDPDLALRLFVGLCSIATLGVFHLVCRRATAPFASLAVTILLSCSSWFLVFSRNGELNVVVALLALASILLTQAGIRGDGPRMWALGGVTAGLACYWHPSAVFMVVGLASGLIIRVVTATDGRRRSKQGAAIFVVALAVVALPRLSELTGSWNQIWATLDQRGILVAQGSSDRAGSTLQLALRSFLLLDTSMAGNPRYLPAGTAPFDTLDGSLLLLGAVVVGLSVRANLAWLGMLVSTLFVSQGGASAIPDLGRAIGALPAIYVLIGQAIHSLTMTLPFRPLIVAVVLVGTPVTAWNGWRDYAAWMASPAAIQARQPGLDYDELDAWLSEQRERLASSGDVLTAREWREAHPRLSSGSRAPRRAAGAQPATAMLGPVEIRATGVVQAGRGPNAPRGVATTPDGDVFVADERGQLGRLSDASTTLETIGRPVNAAETKLWDLASDQEGMLYGVDAERSVVLKFDRRGTPIATLGADWGMYRPRGIGVGDDGKLYVADTGRNRIVVATLAGVLERSIGPRIQAGDLEQPTDIAADLSGRIYVAAPDVGRLFVLDADGRTLGGWPLTRGDTIDSPHLAVLADGVIASTDPRERRIRITDADGRELGSVEASGARPIGIAAHERQLVVTDPGEGRVLSFAIEPR